MKKSGKGLDKYLSPTSNFDSTEVQRQINQWYGSLTEEQKRVFDSIKVIEGSDTPISRWPWKEDVCP